jgi:hypothetical protein
MFMFNLPFGPLTPNIVNGENLFAIKSSNVLFFFYLFQNLFLFVFSKLVDSIPWLFASDNGKIQALDTRCYFYYLGYFIKYKYM